MLTIITQLDEKRTHVEIKARLIFTKPVMFIQGKITSESERGYRQSHEKIILPNIKGLLQKMWDEMD